MRRKLKIVLYSPVLYPNIWGGAIVPYKLAFELLKFADVTLITYDIKVNEGKEIIKKIDESEKFKIFRFKPLVLKLFRSPQFFSLKLLRCFYKKVSRSDVVHMFGFYHYPSLFILSLLTRILNKPLIYTPVGLHEGFEFLRRRKMIFLTKILLIPLRKSKLVVVSERDIGLLKKLGLKNGKVKIIPHGFDAIPQINCNRDENLILCVGRFDWNKGQDKLLFIMKKIVEKSPEKKLVIAGKITKMSFYKKILDLRKKLKLEKNVKIIPDVPWKKLIKLYNRAYVFVFPSSIDSYGLVNLEAMSVGLPVIATNVGGISSIVKNGKTGFLVDVEDHDKFAELILKVMKDKKIRNFLSKNAVSYVKKYSWKKYAEKLMKIYVKEMKN